MIVGIGTDLIDIRRLRATVERRAFSKAIGLGMRMPMTWRACEIVNAASGKPEIRLHGALDAWFAARGWRAHVSVSDENDYATAFVVVECEETTP